MPEQPSRPKKPKKKVTGKRPVREPAKRMTKHTNATSSPKEQPSRATSKGDGTRAPRAGRKRPATHVNRSAESVRNRTTPKASIQSPNRVRARSVSPTQITGTVRRRLVRVTAFLVLPALIASVFLVLHTSLFAIASVKVTGAHETPPAEIVTIAGLNGHPPLIDVNPAEISTRLESLPWIKTAVVARHWPKSVTISVTERVPVAEASIRRHRWELFDSEGRALGFRSLRTKGLVRLRQVSPMPSPGAVVSEALGGEVALADALPIALVSQVQEVTYSTSDELSIKLVLGPIVIFGSASALSEKVVALSTLLANHVSLVGVTTINLRVPSSPVLSSASLVAKVPVKAIKSTPVGTTTPAISG
ncbi:MAG TPA: FtsQ-type POTRA domain-containing protein [Acidimicrobiales bacterium]|nr:FtsQ-type POTRA domain-containing protein [Acidimicrobiales bacterium]